jgi:hypothetical protein
LLEFLFGEDTSLDTKVSVIKEFQEFFNKVWSITLIDRKQNGKISYCNASDIFGIGI